MNIIFREKMDIIDGVKKVVLFNGPPSSGKDTYANMLQEKYGGTRLQFKDVLFDIAAGITGNYDFWRSEAYNREKEIPADWCFGLTPRQLLIKTSEDAIKPAFGDDFFGRASVNRLKPGLNIFSDCGFVAEALPLIETVGPDNMIIFRLNRSECTFNGDSRRYLLRKDFPNVSIVDIKCSTINQTFEVIEEVFSEWVQK